MKLTQKQLDQISLGIQAALGVIIIGLSVKNSAQVETAQMKKKAKKTAKAEAKLVQTEYKEKTKLMKQSYKNRLALAKKTSEALGRTKKISVFPEKGKKR